MGVADMSGTFFLLFLCIFSLVYGNCYDNPSEEPSLIKASENEQGACDWYNGKDTCPKCFGLTKEKISVEKYLEAFHGSSNYSCESPPENCGHYLLQFLCGSYCSPLFVQMVPSEEDEEVEVPQTTICQYFSDRMWEQCWDWKVKDTETGECIPLRHKFGNSQNYYKSIDEGFMVWAPIEPKRNKIVNCFNSAERVSSSYLLIIVLVFVVEMIM